MTSVNTSCRKSPRNSFDIACTINGQAYVLVLALYVIKRVEEDDEWLYEPVMGNFGNLDELLPEEKGNSLYPRVSKF